MPTAWRTLLAGLALPFLVGAPASAQAYLPAARPGSTRAMAMGDAYLVAAPRPDALFYQPAVVDSAEGLEAAYQRGPFGAGLASAVGARSWWKGGVAVGARAYAVPGSSAFSVGAGYAMPVRRFRLGAVAHYVEEQSSTARGGGFALDAGIAHRLGPVTVGAAALTMGPALELGTPDELPTRYRLDAALDRHPLGPLDVAAAAMAGVDRHGHAAAGAGVEVAWWPVIGRTFVARAGVGYDEGRAERRLSPTLGASFEGDDIVLEYAYERLPGGLDVSRFGLGWR